MECPSTRAFVLHLVVSVFKSLCCDCACLSKIALCCTWACLSTTSCAAHEVSVYKNFCAAPGRECIQEPVLHLCVSVYKSFCAHLDVSVFKSLCCTCAGLSTRALICTWTCLSSRACIALVRICLQELCAAPGLVFHQQPVLVSICFKKVSVVSNIDTCSKHQAKRKIIFWFHETNRKTTEADSDSALFGSERFFFRGHPTCKPVFPFLDSNDPLRLLQKLGSYNIFKGTRT
jgi:hypothetical protein